jgi:phosphate:Na+ symporter
MFRILPAGTAASPPDTAAGWIMLGAGLISGMGLFLMGIRMMSDSLTRSTGNQMRNLLARLTRNRFVSFFSGILVTLVFQSSSATTVMLESLVNSRLLRMASTIGVILGAAIGATVTVQIIAFRITDFALPFLAAGFVAWLALRAPRARNGSLALIGFGILLFGMQLMSQSVEPMKTDPALLRLMGQLEHPWAGLVVGTLLTALMQSTTAFIGILIILAGQGLLGLEAAVPMLVGANLGTAVTAIIAAAGTSRESKQVALAHTLFKAGGALLIIWWIPSFTRLVETVSVAGGQHAVARQIANAHTVFNILAALAFLPLTGVLARLVTRLLPDRDRPQPSLATWYLDDGMLQTPSLALRLAQQEVQRMMETARRMTGDILAAFLHKDASVIRRVEEGEATLDYLRDAIRAYLVNIVRNATGRQVEEAFQMMYALDEYEQIGDLVSGHLSEKAREWCASAVQFSDRGKADLQEFHTRTLDLIDQSRQAFGAASLRQAKQSKENYNRFRRAFFELERKHYERLKQEVENSAESSTIHLEIIGTLKSIGSHATNIARVMLEEPKLRPHAN